MKHFALLFFTVAALLPSIAQAAEPLSFERMRLRWVPGVHLLIPKDAQADRVYITSQFKIRPVSIQLRIDDQTLVRAIGTSQTASMPPELLQGYGSRFTEVAAFPLASFKAAKKSIVIGFALGNSHQRQVVIQGKRLAEIRSHLP